MNSEQKDEIKRYLVVTIIGILGALAGYSMIQEATKIILTVL